LPGVPLDRQRVTADFAAAVNMTAAELRAWLATEDSRRVGWKGSDGSRRESVATPADAPSSKSSASRGKS
jgi:hypothetical protein